MFRISPEDPFSFENQKYLPEISECLRRPTAEGAKYSVYKCNLQDRLGQIDSKNDPDHSVFAIDGCIWAQTPSKSFRSDKAQCWQEKLGTAKQWAWIQGGVAALIALGAAGAAAAKIHPYMVVAIGVCSAVCMVFCGMNLGRALEASRQINGWNADPVEKIAGARRKAYEAGFPHVFKNDLKLPPNATSNHQILLPFEVESIFEKYFDKFCTDLLSTQPSGNDAKEKWLRRFTDCNPVAKAVLEFAYGNLQQYEKVSSDYEVLHSHLTGIRNGYAKLRENAHQETEKVKKNINASRTLTLAPFNATLEYYLKKADTDRRKNLEGKIDPKEIQEIENEYTKKTSKYLSFYVLATTPTNLLFDQKITEAESNLQSVLNNIQTNEASSHAEHFDYAWTLLESARRFKDSNRNSFKYNSPAFFSEKIVFDIPKISPVDVDAVEEAKKQQPKDFDSLSDYKEYLESVARQLQEQ